MASTTDSSIRVSNATRKKVGELAARLGASSQREVIDLALAKLEHSLFWEGFDEEAAAYLAAYPAEAQEREIFAGTIADGL